MIELLRCSNCWRGPSTTRRDYGEPYGTQPAEIRRIVSCIKISLVGVRTLSLLMGLRSQATSLLEAQQIAQCVYLTIVVAYPASF